MKKELWAKEGICFIQKTNLQRDIFDRHRFESVMKLNDLYREYGCNDVSVMLTMSRKVFYRFIRDVFRDLVVNGDVFYFPNTRVRRGQRNSNLHIGYVKPYGRSKGAFSVEHGFDKIATVLEITGSKKSINRHNYQVYFRGWLRQKLFQQIKSNFKYGIHQL